MKLCECGCGEEVTNDKNRFLHGHSNRGRKDIYLKRDQNFLDKYGVKNPNQLDSVRLKIRKTNEKRFGGPAPIFNNKIKEKIRKTNEQIYNGPAPMCSDEIQEKTKRTNKERIGFEFTFQSPEVKRKSKLTMIKNFGVEHALQSGKCKEKYKKTCNKNNTCNWPMQSSVVREKSKNSLIEKYGVDNYAKTPEFRKFAREQMIRLIMSNYKDGSKFSPTKGFYEKEIFEELQKHCSYLILEDQTFISLFPDRYISELNIIIELYEPWHKQKCWLRHDLIRQKELEDELGCKFFIIWLNEWNENKEFVILNFKEVLNSDRSN